MYGFSTYIQQATVLHIVVQVQFFQQTMVNFIRYRGTGKVRTQCSFCWSSSYERFKCIKHKAAIFALQKTVESANLQHKNIQDRHSYVRLTSLDRTNVEYVPVEKDAVGLGRD